MVLQAFNSVRSDVAAHITSNLRTPYNFLKAVQKDNGQFSYNLNFASNFDVLNTAYAVIGLAGKALPVTE